MTFGGEFFAETFAVIEILTATRNQLVDSVFINFCFILGNTVSSCFGPSACLHIYTMQ